MIIFFIKQQNRRSFAKFSERELLKIPKNPSFVLFRVMKDFKVFKTAFFVLL